MSAKDTMLYEGKAKQIFSTNRKGVYRVVFKDDATAFNGLKRGSIAGKGACNAEISAILFHLLERKGIQTHFLELRDAREMLVKAVEIIPVEVVARNIAAGSLAKRLGMEEGTELAKPVLEFYYKSDALGDPMINEYHIDAMGWASRQEMTEVKETAWRINRILVEHLRAVNLMLVDFKLEFGRHDGQVLLADEISPDTCRLWDADTRDKLDKDRFRRDLGGVEDAYQEVLRRVKTLAG